MYRGRLDIAHLPHKNLGKQEVHIFFGKIPDPFSGEDMLAVLSPTERERYQAYKAPNKQKEFLYGRFFMKSILASYLKKPVSQISISLNPHKRPYLTDQELQFNLSHSFGAFAMIISKTHPVGIDIEYTQRNIQIEDGRHVFMPEEIQSMQAKPSAEAHLEFLQRWTLKEAIYKAADQGPKLLFNEFRVDLAELSLSSSTPLLAPINRDMGRFSLLEDYLISFAIENPDKEDLRLQSFHL